MKTIAIKFESEAAYKRFVKLQKVYGKGMTIVTMPVVEPVNVEPEKTPKHVKKS